MYIRIDRNRDGTSLSFPNLSLIAPAAKADVITARVTSDAEEHLTVFGGSDGFGSVDLTSSDLELISEGNGGLDWQAIGLQLTGLGIARGSLINSAAVTFTIDPGEVGQAGNLALTIFGELTPTAPLLSVDFTAVPEPSSFLLIAVFGIFAVRGQRFKKPMLS